jgi:hypothetical protein
LEGGRTIGFVWWGCEAVSYRFFLSYARETYRASQSGGKNLLGQFFDELRNQVALKAAEKIDDVCCQDVERLHISDEWGSELLDGMQDSAVLVCIVSPHYLKSLPCGRELGLFRERLAQLNAPPREKKNRIIPIFWVDELSCHQAMLPHVKEFLQPIQLTQKGLPDDYPRVGLFDFYGQQDNVACYKFCKLLAARIAELSLLPPLPKLQNATEFGKLPSFFEPRTDSGDEGVAKGPRGTNVVYAVATREIIGDSSTNSTYGEKAEEWRPFTDKPNRTIGLLTQNALRDAGQDATQYRVMGLSEQLLQKMKKARGENSPVLVVLDRASLRFESIKSHLSDYDTYDAPHIGLVTAGGTSTDESLLREVLPVKYLGSRDHHLWTVPPSSETYELSVTNTVSALRSDLQKLSPPTIPLPPSTMPTLTQPGT